MHKHHIQNHTQKSYIKSYTKIIYKTNVQTPCTKNIYTNHIQKPYTNIIYKNHIQSDHRCSQMQPGAASSSQGQPEAASRHTQCHNQANQMGGGVGGAKPEAGRASPGQPSKSQPGPCQTHSNLPGLHKPVALYYHCKMTAGSAHKMPKTAWVMLGLLVACKPTHIYQSSHMESTSSQVLAPANWARLMHTLPLSALGCCLKVAPRHPHPGHDQTTLANSRCPPDPTQYPGASLDIIHPDFHYIPLVSTEMVVIYYQIPLVNLG